MTSLRLARLHSGFLTGLMRSKQIMTNNLNPSADSTTSPREEFLLREKILHEQASDDAEKQNDDIAVAHHALATPS
jgi:hypothetical protein